jgi:hypothetical protein
VPAAPTTSPGRRLRLEDDEEELLELDDPRELLELELDDDRELEDEEDEEDEDDDLLDDDELPDELDEVELPDEDELEPLEDDEDEATAPPPPVDELLEPVIAPGSVGEEPQAAATPATIRTVPCDSRRRNSRRARRRSSASLRSRSSRSCCSPMTALVRNGAHPATT